MVNRKAVAWVPFTVIILFVVSMGAVIHYQNEGIKKTMDFGIPQRAVLEMYADGEAARQYIVRSAKFAANQALFSLSQNGGYEQIECPNDVYPRCDVFSGKNKIDEFACSLEFPDSQCTGYEIDSLCSVFPCTQTTRAQLVCIRNIDSTISCKIMRNLVTVREFNCASLEEDECKDYSAALTPEGKILDLKLSCEEISVEKECKISKCNSIGEYSYWYNGQSCFPSAEEVSVVFSILFEDYFDRFLYAYDNIPLDEEQVTLYDITQLNLKIDANSGVIEGIPVAETYVSQNEDEEGNIIGEETVQQEAYLLFAKKIVDKKGLQPPVSIEYSINPYFKYTMPYTPYGLLTKARNKANSAASGCSDAVEKCAAQAQESLASDTEFSWTITGEVKDGANIIKFDAVPIGLSIFGIDQAGELSNLQSSPPIRFAVKYTGTVPTI